MFYIFLIGFLSVSICKKFDSVQSKDNSNIIIRNAWSYLEKDFFSMINIDENLIKMKRFNALYDKSQITFIFSSHFEAKEVVEVYKAIINFNSNNEFSSVSYEKISLSNKITIHDVVYTIIHDEIVNYAKNKGMVLNHIKKVEQFSDEVWEYKLFLVTVNMKEIDEDLYFYVSVDAHETYGTILQVINDYSTLYTL